MENGFSDAQKSWGLHIPSLGRFGYFETDFDYSGMALKNANDDALMVAFADDEALVAQVAKQKNNELYSLKDVNDFRQGLLARNFEEIKHIGNHGDGTIKYTYRKKGSMPWIWGQIEFCVGPNNAYSSYNYGNNPLTHLLLDKWGWDNRGY